MSALATTTDPVSQDIVAVVIVALVVLLAKEAAHRILIAMVSASLLPWLVTHFTPWHLISFEASATAGRRHAGQDSNRLCRGCLI